MVEGVKMSYFTPDRFMMGMRRTRAVLDGMLNGVSQEKALRMTDGPDGWCVVEIVCHLRDFEEIFHNRVVMMLEQDNPTFPNIDQVALAAEGNYKGQSLDAALKALTDRRRKHLDLLSGLTDAQWQRPGIHPRQGPTNVLERTAHVVMHDLDHLDQIAKTLQLPRLSL